MALSWNEIRDRALIFSKDWANTQNEESDAKPFLDAFFEVFGIPRKKVGTFEYHIKKVNGRIGKIDLLWKGVILIEMKSKDKDLDAAFIQAKNYVHGLAVHDSPKYILVCDFHTFRLFETEENKTHEFQLADLVKNVHLFGFIAGYQKRVYKEQDPVNIKAAELMGKLHDSLKEVGYHEHPLEVYLVRLLFCLFAEDTTIFEKQQFQSFIEDRTSEDGSDLAAKLHELFQVLNTHQYNRLKNLDEDLNAFPYVNGKLFEEILPTAGFDTAMRKALLNCCYLDWSLISPAIFGSMFQSVMNPQERRNLGAHYTSEKNILKLIKPLFLDNLWKEFETVKHHKNKLPEFHKRISTLRFLDPACGCGNFLVITYRELRLLELEILRAQYKNQSATSIESIIWLDVDMMHGIEYEEFPARIAEVAMWLIDHQMNMLISNEFGQYFVRLPLKKAAKIVYGNALQIDWNDLLKKETIYVDANETTLILNEPEVAYQTINVRTNNLTIIDERKFGDNKIILKNAYDYIIGNPPFIGKSNQSESQKKDLETIFTGVKGIGILDYVTCWYLKAAQLIQNTNTKVAFVSTNSISQGEQVGILWNLLFNHYKIKIHFAHRTFKWSNEAKGNAAVHCVIIGFANFDTNDKTIYEYEDIKGEPHGIKVKNINPYLVDARNTFILARSSPICKVPPIIFGSMPNDGGYLLLSKNEKEDYVKSEKHGEIFIREFTGGEEFINNIERFCFWMKDVNPEYIHKCPILKHKIEKVKEYRLKSSRIATNKLAQFPSLFGELRQPETSYILIPNLSSGLRKYIPIGFKPKEVIASNLALIIPDATVFHFGVLTSNMHMAWVRFTCGMLSTSLRYSNKMVYNNYPWPLNPTEKQIKFIEEKAQQVLDARAAFPNNSLADLYDLLTMPPILVKAHTELDKAVDLAYRPQPFTNEAHRMEFLFELYEKYTADLFSTTKVKKSKK